MISSSVGSAVSFMEVEAEVVSSAVGSVSLLFLGFEDMVGRLWGGVGFGLVWLGWGVVCGGVRG